MTTTQTETPGSPDLLLVVGSLDVGGTERHVSNVARSLGRAGWHVWVYSVAGDGPLRGELESAGVKVLLSPVGQIAITDAPIPRALRMVPAAVHLTYLMLRMRPRIVHFFLPAAYLVGGIASMLAGVKIRVMSRRSLNNYQHGYPAMRWLEIRLHKRMSAVLGNSDAVVRQLRQDEDVPRDRLGLIYNGIGPVTVVPNTRAAVRSSLKIEDETLVYIIVANLIPYKGHLDLVAAFGMANQDVGQPWHLLIVGRDDGAGRDILALAQELGIENRISFLGPRSDVANLLLASDIGLLCSHQEGFSNAILESMAAGLPMIVTAVGGNAEAVLDGRTGLVVPPHAPQALAKSIVCLARDRDQRERYGSAGRRRVEELFTLESCMARYDALYRGLLQGRMPRAIPEVHAPPSLAVAAPQPDRPLVSVIMSMRNSAATVGAAIRSVQLQTLKNWELIVIDDGSRDESAAVVSAINDPRIHLVRESTSAGLATRLNQAVALTRGAFIARMDADDLCFPNRLARQVERLQQNPQIDVLGCGAVVFADDEMLIGTLPIELTHEQIAARPFLGFPFPHPTWCGRAEWFRDNPYDQNLMKAQDQDLLLRAFAHSRFAAVPDVLVGYRQDILDLKKMLQGRRVFIGSLWRYARASGRPLPALWGTLVHLTKSMVDIVSISLGLNRLAQRHRLEDIPPAVRGEWQELRRQLGADRVAARCAS